MTGQGLAGPALDSEQRAELERARRTWADRVLAAGPTDREAAEEGVRQSYWAAGLPPPERMVWFGSPLPGTAAAAVLRGFFDLDAMRGPVWDAARGELTAHEVHAVAGGAGQPEHARIVPPLWRAIRSEVMRQHEALWREVWTPWREWRPPDPMLAMLRADLASRLRLMNRQGMESEPEDWDEEPFGPGPEQLVEWIWGHAMGLSREAARYALIEWLGQALPGVADLGPLAGAMRVARVAGWWWPFERVAILTERPVAVHRDQQGRPHCADGPALGFPDGWRMYAWHGVRVPAALFARLPHLRAKDIPAEPNAELRRVMLEFFGLERYVREAGAVRVHRDETGTLWCAEVPGDEPLMLVEVRNATPEPDGAHKVYWLRVPPWTQTAREAVAWTFGLPANDYRPLRET